MKYRIGDILVVKEWDTMVEEFGIDELGNISCEFLFTPEMRYMCGKQFTLSSINSFGYLSSEEGIENDESGVGWNISEDMLEPFVEEPICVDQADELMFSEFISDFIVV